MHKIILTTINARYAHSSFGLRYLYANLNEYRETTNIYEFVKTDSVSEIADKILMNDPLIIGIGVYIWNASEIGKLVKLIKKVSPKTSIKEVIIEISEKMLGVTAVVDNNKFIRNKEETLYVLIYALQDLILKDLIQPQNSNENLLDEVTKIKTKTQLARYLSHYAHSDIDGLSLPTIKNIFAMVDRLSEYNKNDPKYFFLQLIKVLKDTVLKITYCIQQDQVNECFGIFSIKNLSELSEYFHKHEFNNQDEILSDIDLINKTLKKSVNKFNNL